MVPAKTGNGRFDKRGWVPSFAYIVQYVSYYYYRLMLKTRCTYPLRKYNVTILQDRWYGEEGNNIVAPNNFSFV